MMIFGLLQTMRMGHLLQLIIIQVCPQVGTHLLVWHHAYEGIGFGIIDQGTEKECKRQRRKEIHKLVEEKELSEEDICENVVDTGSEWEVFDIVPIKQIDRCKKGFWLLR